MSGLWSWLTRTRLGRGVSLAALTSYVIAWSVPGAPWSPGWQGNDASVYRAAARALLGGADPYAATSNGFAFTYPPIALVFVAPTALLPEWCFLPLACGLPALLLVLALFLCLHAGGRTPAGWEAVTGSLPLLMLYPVLTSVVVGQLDALVLLLVVADVTVMRRSRWHGLGIGLAAALKITPLVFGLWFLARRDLRGGLKAVAAFGLTTLLAHVALPGPSSYFWTAGLFDTTRVGRITVALNQALSAPIARLLTPEAQVLSGSARTVWVVACVAVVAVGLLAAARQSRAGHPITAACVVATVGLLVSPITWSHHWVWIIPWAAAVATELRRGPWAAGVTVLALLLALPVHWTFGNFVPHGGSTSSWGPLAMLAGALVPAVACGLVAATALGMPQPRPQLHW